MPLIELDILMAFINRSDRHYKAASRIMEAAISDRDIYLSSAALVEMSLISDQGPWNPSWRRT